MAQKRVAIVTGAGRGIGLATAQELSAHGYAVVITARNADELRKTGELIDGALCIAGDVTDALHIDTLVKETLRHHGRIDAIVNNAGFAPLRDIEQITHAEWEQIINTNLSAAFYLTKAAWPVFKRQSAGVVVNISSEASRDPFQGLGFYGAAKAGLNLLGKALAREGAAYNIRVHTIAPGAVETQMLRGILSREQFPTDKTLLPEEVARVVGQCIEGDLRYASG